MAKSMFKRLFALAFFALASALLAQSTSAAVTLKEYPLPSPNSEPNSIAVGADGNMWFTEQGYQRIGRITSDGAITEFSNGLTGGKGNGINPGPDGNEWFAELFAAIGKITPQGQITEYTDVSSPYFITAAPDGNLWFTDNGANAIGKITPDGIITEYIVPNSVPQGITVGPDGNVWFAGDHFIGKITLGGQVTLYPVNSPSGPYLIAAGPDDKLWFTDRWDSQIGSMTLDGVVTQYYPSPNSQPVEIMAGADGNLWFTEFSGNRIGRITTSGAITEYPVPTPNAGPNGLRPDLAGNLWFTEYNGNKIAEQHMCYLRLGAPDPIAPRIGTVLNVSRPVLFWIPGLCASSYTVVIKQGLTSNGIFFKQAGITNLLYQTPNLPRHHNYSWQVQACRGNTCVASRWRAFWIP